MTAPAAMAAGATAGTNMGVGGAGGTSPGGGAGADDTGGLSAGGAHGGGGGGGGGYGFTGGGGGSDGAYVHTGGSGGNLSQSFGFTNPAGATISGGIGGQGNTLYGGGGGGGGGAGIGGGGGGGSGTYTVGGGGGGGGGGAGIGGGGGSGGYGGGGVGGAGGAITGTVSITNNGKIYGGAGAAGIRNGAAGDGGDAIGSGGIGGVGVGGGAGGVGGGITGSATTIVNTGLLQGGNGGAPSTGLTTGGAGGVGVRGSNLTVINSGTIAGGFDGNTGTVQSNAILFTGGTNSLELQSGWVINGHVGNGSGVTGTSNTLILGGSTTTLSGTGTGTGTIFDVSQIGAKYQDFNLFQKSGSSTWLLANTTGAVTPWTITGGTLQISSDAALGSTNGTLTFGGSDSDTTRPGSGILEVTASTTSARNIILNSIAGIANTIQVDSGLTYTASTVISGAGALTKTGAGTLALNGANTYAGGTFLNAGTMVLGNNVALGTGVLAMADGTTLSFTSSNFTVANKITIAGTGNVTPPTTTIQTLTGIISDGSSPGLLAMQGPGTLVLTAADTYTGGTTISAGTLQLGNGGTAGSIVGNVTDNGTLAFDRSDTATFSGAISGTGAVSQIGTGTTILTANNTYSGGTTISAGILQLGNGGSSGSIVGNVADNGALTFDRADTVTFPGTISGSGSVNQIGTGTTVLTANNTYTGGTVISAGTLQLGNGGTSGSIVGNVTDNGTLAFNRSDTVTFSGVISGSGGVNQIGSGTTILDAKNPYTGPTNVSVGTLVVGDASALGASLSGGGLVTVASGATLGGFGSIAGSVANNGTFAVGNALAAFSGAANTTFHVGGNLTNTGLITLVGPAPGNRLAVGGNFVGNGGTLALQTLLNAGGPLSNQSTDRLLVGGSADPTVVRITPVGTGAFTAVNFPTATTGISIIQVAGSSSVGAFTLAGGAISQGLYTYTLNAYGPGSPNGPADPGQTLIGTPGANWDYRLQNVYVTPAGPVAPTPEPSAGAPPPAPPADARPQVVPQVPAYISSPTVLFIGGLEDINDLHRRLGEIRDAPGEPQQFEMFVRAYGGIDHYSSDRDFTDFGYNFRQSNEAVQFGGSGIVFDDGRGQLRAGLAVALGQTFFTPSAIDGPSHGMFKTGRLSGIATYQSASGFYVDAIASGGLFNGRVTTAVAAPAASLGGSLVGLSVESGYPMPTGWQEVVVEPEGQLTWQRLNFLPRTDTGGMNIDIGTLDQGMVRIGGRLVRRFEDSDGSQISPYLKANLLKSFGDGSAITLNGTGFDTGAYGTAVQLGGGVTDTTPDSRPAFFGDVVWQQRLGRGGVSGWTFTGGLRFDL